MILKVTKNILAFLLLILSTEPVFSKNTDFRFTHLTPDDGLSQSNVTCILQDSRGFMWFGTFNGLNRYDGYTFELFHYHADDPHSLSHNYVSALYEDHNGYLWIGTSDGLNRYDRRMNRFQSYTREESDSNSIRDNQIETIFEDSKGRLWIGTRNGGLALFRAESESFIHYFHDANDNRSLSSNFIRVIFEDSNGNLWIAHENGALDIFNEQQKEFKHLAINGKKLTDARISSIVESPDKHVWIGTQGAGLYRIVYEQGSARQIAHYVYINSNKNGINSNTVLCLMIDRQGNLWIGTEDNGINILDLETNAFQYCQHDPFDQSSLNHDSIWSLYEDRAGNIWIGTYAYGINLLTGKESNFHHYTHHAGLDNCLSHDMVNSFAESDDNNLYIATDGGGLDCYNRSDNRFVHYNRRNSNIDTDIIVSLLEDSRGRLWVGTWSDGLYQFDKQLKKFVQHFREKDGLASNRVLNISESIDGGLWLSTFWGGLTYFHSDKGITKIYDKDNSGISDNDVRVTLQDFDGNVWVGTDVGLDFLNLETEAFIHYKHEELRENSLSKGFVHSIIQSRDSTIWIGTTGGLNRLDRKTQKFVHYTTVDGLPDNEIKCIIEENDSILWLSTNKGISRFDVPSNEFKNYDVTDGLQGNDFNARSGLITRSGEILFGGNNGFNIFRPNEIKDNTYVPPVVITDFKLFNKPVPIGVEHSPLQQHISETQELRLSYRHAVFSFEFAALNYISPEKNQYAYVMEGFKRNWNYVKSTRTATYTNLDPGDYLFKVKASNNDGIWNEEGVSLKITIDPPFWKTWWAYLIEALLGLGIFYFVASYFISRQRFSNALAKEKLELEKMYELDQMKTRFFTNVAHEFHSPLTLIISPLEKLISSEKIDDKIKSSLKLIRGNAKRLQRMIDQLKDIQKLDTGDLQLSLTRGNIVRFIETIVNSFQDHAKDHHIHFQFQTEIDAAIVWFDEDKLDKIIYNLLSNAFKFTPDGGDITVCASILSSAMMKGSGTSKRMANEYMEIIVHDNGIGIPEDKIEHIFQRYYHIEDYGGRHYEGSGIGLALVYELIKLYGGEISVSSQEGQGATFNVRIPIDEGYLEENQLVGEFNILPSAVFSNLDARDSDVLELDDSAIEKSKISLKDIPIILIVEDDEEIRNYIKNTLESRYRVVFAENGAIGHKKANKIIPDLIICDIKMPVLSGTELCKMLRDDEKTAHIPVILLTAYSTNDFKIEGLNKGADAYLTKPFSVDVLEAQIANLLESRRKLRINFSRKIQLEPQKVDIEDTDAKFLQLVMDTIEKHMSDNELNADFLSKKVGMSRMQLYRKLRALTNQTVHEFIRSIRLKRAVQLLEQRRMTITEVAYEVGFNDLTYFARCFRKQYHKSPSEYISS
ncbi:response regulator [candidate division KSB1 bacterium]|nr:response regulator [candidate division KSB1 bacterium]